MKILLFALFIFHSLCVLSQESHLKIQEIGGLFVENKIGFDGGLTHLKLKTLKGKSNLKSKKVKLRGQVVYRDLNEEPVPTIEIFLGYISKENKLVIIDTLYTFDFDQAITLFNRKRLNENGDGIFRIKAKLTQGYAIYISGPASYLLEITIEN